MTRSSAETKFRAVALGLCELLWMRIVLKDLKIDVKEPIKLFCENQSTISIAHDPV